MVASLVRTGTFFNKWMADVVREPALMVSLVLGPFLILFLFGAGARIGGAPKPRAIVVAPPAPASGSAMDLNPDDVNQYLQIVGQTGDEQQARAALGRREADLVVVLPDQPEQAIRRGERAKVRIFTNEIDPLRDSYARAYLYYQISTLNQKAVQQSLATVQASAGQVRDLVTRARGQLQAVRAAQGDAVAARRELDQLQATLDPLTAAANQAVATGEELLRLGLTDLSGPVDRARSAAAELARARQRITDWETRLASGLGPSPQELDQLDTWLTEVEQVTTEFGAIPADVLSAPFELELTNVAPAQVSAIGFYAPAVLVLLLQHLAVTLAALSMARVRLLGLMELLQTSPVRPIEVTIGNYLTYGALCIIAGGALVALLVGVLGVPIYGSLLVFAATALLLIACSLGLGFIIAMVSSSEQQAAQLTMLVLIASVFFSGFMIFLELIEWPVRAVSYLLPATYAIQALRDVMLRGTTPALLDMGVLIGAAAAFFILTTLLFRREFRPR